MINKQQLNNSNHTIYQINKNAVQKINYIIIINFNLSNYSNYNVFQNRDVKSFILLIFY